MGQDRAKRSRGLASRDDKGGAGQSDEIYLDSSPMFYRTEYQDLGVLWKAWASKGKEMELSQKQDRAIDKSSDSDWDASTKPTMLFERDDTIEFKKREGVKKSNCLCREVVVRSQQKGNSFLGIDFWQRASAVYVNQLLLLRLIMVIRPWR